LYLGVIWIWRCTSVWNRRPATKCRRR